jgi:WD40 repeat protein
VQILKGFRKGVRSVAFSPDGARLAAGGYDGGLRLWELRGGEATRLNRAGATLRNLVWVPDGSAVFWTGCGYSANSVCRTTVTGQTEALTLTDNEVGGICLAPDGRTLYAAARSAIRRWDIATGRALTSWRTTSPGFLAVSPDGQTLASTHPHSVLARNVAFHVALWDVATGRRRARLLDCRELYDGVAFSPEGTRLAALGHQSLWLWEMPAGRPVAQRPSKKFYTGLAFSPDGRLLATSGNDGAVRFCDGHTAEPLQTFAWDLGKVLCVAFSPDGMRAAAGGSTGDIVVWDVD